MATPVVMPRQGNTVETCTIVEWHKKLGDSVSKGEILFTYETDKATFECESPAAGTLLEIFCGTDEDIPVLNTVAAIGAPGEDVSSLKPTGSASATTAPAPTTSEVSAPANPAPAPVGTQPLVPQVVPTTSKDSPVSPRARMTAREKGVEATVLAGTGPGGRVIERDVLNALANGQGLTKTAAAAAGQGMAVPAQGTGIGGRIRLADLTATPGAGATIAAPAADEFVEKSMSKMRTLIADRMSDSLASTAQLTMTASADATRLMAYRKQVKAHGAELGLNNITINDLVAFALTRVLPRFPELNSIVSGTSVRQYNRVHLALAVDTPRGLMVPVVRCADLLSLNDLTAAFKTCAGQCNDGSINPDQLNGGTFTMSNLGAFGIESFTPIINAPQAAILGVNTISPRPVAGEDGALKLVPHIGLSLTIDHRVVDGAPAARFLKDLCSALTNFDLTLSL